MGLTKEEKAERRRIYRVLHKEQIKAYDKQYAKKYAKDHVLEIAQKQHAYYMLNREKNLLKGKIYKSTHPEYRIAIKKWQETHPVNVHRSRKKTKFKRRELGYIPLNEPFNGCDAHHIDKEHVIHIPVELHHSVYHNVWTGKGMDKINFLAFEYMKNSNSDHES